MYLYIWQFKIEFLQVVHCNKLIRNIFRERLSKHTRGIRKFQRHVHTLKSTRHSSRNKREIFTLRNVCKTLHQFFGPCEANGNNSSSVGGGSSSRRHRPICATLMWFLIKSKPEMSTASSSSLCTFAARVWFTRNFNTNARLLAFCNARQCHAKFTGNSWAHYKLFDPPVHCHKMRRWIKIIITRWFKCIMWVTIC